MSVSLAFALATLGAGFVAGGVGSLLGLGGGVFLVPFLVLVLGLPFQTAAAISLVAVIATSSAVSAAAAGRQLINLRLGMVLEVSTAAGGLAGGLTAQVLAPETLQKLFGLVAGAVALVILWRRHHRNLPLAEGLDPGPLGGVFDDPETGRRVAYRMRRLPLGLVASFVAGNVSTLLGLGGGIIKVPVLNTWCGIPLRVAAATSAFMIGVTATSGAIVYYGHGHVVPELAAAAVLGVQLGSSAGMRAAERARVHWLKILLASILLAVSILMLVRAA